MKNLDVDSILHQVKSIRASLNVHVRGIDGFFGDDQSWLEFEAMTCHTRNLLNKDIERIDIIIDDLRKAGAKDYDLSDKLSDKAAA